MAAEWKDTPANRRFFVEALWGLGISLDKLGSSTGESLEVNLRRGTGKSFNDWIKAEFGGITPDMVGMAKRMATWRADPKADTPTQLKAYFSEVLGYPADQIGATLAGRVQELRGGAAQGTLSTEAADRLYLQAAKELVDPQTFTQLTIKTRTTEAATAANLMADTPAWNPLRGDQPTVTSRPVSKEEYAGRTYGPFKPDAPKTPAPAAPGTGTGTTPDTTLAPTKPLTPDQLRAEIERNYGGWSVLADEPEIQRILDDLFTGKIDLTKADELFKTSTFYKTVNSNARQFRIFEKTDPANATLQREEQKTKLTGVVREAGIDPATLDLNTLADQTLRFGWSDAQIRRFVAGEVKKDPTGAKTGVAKDIDATAYKYLVPLSDGAKLAWQQSIVAGDRTAEDFDAYLRTQAKSLFPSMAAELDANPAMDVRTYLSPYTETVAQTLGMRSEDVDWRDPKFSRFINQVDPKTNQRTVMSIADMARTMRLDPTYKWEETEPGRNAKRNFTSSLMSQIGFAPGRR